MSNDPMIEDLLSSLDVFEDAPLRDATVGQLLVTVDAGRFGLASRVCPPGTCGQPLESPPDPARWTGRSARELAREGLGAPIPSTPTHDYWISRSIGIAACNALLPIPPAASRLRAQDLLSDCAEANVAVVGHFPFVRALASQVASLTVLELYPRDGDRPACDAPEVLATADVALLTATTLTNGTLSGLLALCPSSCRRILLGPSTPFSPALFEHGIDVLAGAVVLDGPRTCTEVAAGLPFRDLTGVDAFCWER